jgi:hypothetical protein
MADDFITVVSGLPRSGTSMMMQMLQAGGLNVLTDGLRAADESNPRGYFELDPVKLGAKNHAWIAGAAGSAVKVIHLLLLELPPEPQFRVIFLLRDLDEVISSQRAMLKQQGKTAAALPDAVLAGVFQKQLDKVKHWLADQPNFKVLYVNHRDVIDQPQIEAEKINDFLGGNLSVPLMVSAVSRALHRQRKPLA